MSKVNTNNNIADTLIELGLGQNEANLYEIMLSVPQASIQDLQKKSQHSRTMLYYILNNLEQFGLIFSLKQGKKTVYSAEKPQKLEELLNEQEQNLHRQKHMLTTVIDDLWTKYRSGHNRPGVVFYEGKEQMIEAYEKILDLRMEILSIEDAGEMMNFFPDYVARYIKKRIERKIWNRSIVPETNKINESDPKYFIDSHHIPIKDFPFNMDIKICSNTVQFATLKEGQAVAVHINDPLIAENFRVMFEYIWKQSGKNYGATAKQKTVALSDGESNSGGVVLN